MATDSYTVGPGTFTIGAADLAVQAQVTSLEVSWAESVTTGEDLQFLDGTSLAGEESATYRASIAGNVVQGLGSGGFVAYCWAHKGEEVEFTFAPSTAEDMQVTGICRVVPITIGGAAKSRPRSDFTFAVIGDPVLAAIP